MNEAYVKSTLVKQLLANCAIQSYRFEDMFRGGIPDLLIGCAGQCAWIEVKYADAPLMPHTWRAYKPAQSEAGIRLRFNTGIPYYYFCRNFDGFFSISTIESVVECRDKKSSLDGRAGSINGTISQIAYVIYQILKGELKLYA